MVGAGVGSPRSTVVDLEARRVVRRLFADGNGPVFGVATGDDGRVSSVAVASE